MRANNKKDVTKQFVLTLHKPPRCDDSCVTNVQKRITSLHFGSRHAECQILRYNSILRMLSIRCGVVSSAKAAMLLNGRLEKLPGVRTSTQDAIISSDPSTSAEVEKDDGTGPATPMFRPAARVRIEDNSVPYNWGLDRLDEDLSPLDNLPVDFSCYPSKGSGTRVFVIDTGCKTDHDEFSNATIATYIAPGSKFKSAWDDNGHGTHIAGIIVGRNVGVAKNANVTCIKAFDKNGNGAATDTISAVEFVLQEKAQNPSSPFIVNLSYSALTGLTTTALDELVYASSAYGVLFVVSAGNAAVDSCLFSPSKAEQALTVTASTKRDTLEADSNIGPCVEFIAPGHDIVSAGIDSRSDYVSLNGTSMATPHVVGLCALVLAEHLELQDTPEQVRDNLYEMLVTTRSANVANYIMPLMETGCGNPDTELNAIGTDSIPLSMPIISPSLSPSPESSPDLLEPFASFSTSPSPIPKYSPGDKRFWQESRAKETNKDFVGPFPEMSEDSAIPSPELIEELPTSAPRLTIDISDPTHDSTENVDNLSEPKEGLDESSPEASEDPRNRFE